MRELCAEFPVQSIAGDTRLVYEREPCAWIADIWSSCGRRLRRGDLATLVSFVVRGALHTMAGANRRPRGVPDGMRGRDRDSAIQRWTYRFFSRLVTGGKQ